MTIPDKLRVGIRGGLAVVAVALLVIVCVLVMRARRPSTFDEAVVSATRLELHTVEMGLRDGSDEQILLDVDDPVQIAELVAGMQFVPEDRQMSCGCMGDYLMVFYRGDKRVSAFSIHHSDRLRWRGGAWKSDTLMTDESVEHLMDWLADHGAPAPRAAREDRRREAAIRRDAEETWRAAMPAAIRDASGDHGVHIRPPYDTTAAQHGLLFDAMPDQDARIRALLHWFGSGRGYWSGYPSYESDAEGLLSRYKPAAILAAVDDVDLRATEVEGLARLFGSYGYDRQYPGSRELLSDDLRRRLLVHSLATALDGDDDKRERARNAFGPDGTEH